MLFFSQRFLGRWEVVSIIWFSYFGEERERSVFIGGGGLGFQFEACIRVKVRNGFFVDDCFDFARFSEFFVVIVLQSLFYFVELQLAFLILRFFIFIILYFCKILFLELENKEEVFRWIRWGRMEFFFFFVVIGK